MLRGLFFFSGKKKTAAKEKAKKLFMNFVSSELVAKRIATHLGKIPALKKARNHPEVKALKELAPLIEGTKFAKPAPAQIEMRAAWDGLRIMVQRALSGKESPEQAAKTGQSIADEALQSISSARSH